MKRRTFLRGTVTGLLMLAILAIPLSLSVSGQGTPSPITRTIQLTTLTAYPIGGISMGFCHHFEVPLGVSGPGDIIGGTVTSDGGPVTFAIVNFNEGQQFQSGEGTSKTCSGLDSHSRYYKEGQSFQFQYPVTVSNVYIIVLVNKNSAQIAVTLSPYRITTTPGQSYTPSTPYYTAATPYSSAAGTRTASAANTSSSTISPFALSFDSTSLAIGVGVVALIAFLFWMKNSSKSKPPAQMRPVSQGQQTAQVTGGEVQKQFCVNCGIPLPPGSKFCGKCGTAQ